MSRRRIPRNVLVSEVEHLTVAGQSALEIAARLGLAPGSVARALHRANRRDLASPFDREALRARVAQAGRTCPDCGRPISLYRRRCLKCAAWHRQHTGARRHSTSNSTQKAAA